MMGAEAPNPCPFQRDSKDKPNASPAAPPPKPPLLQPVVWTRGAFPTRDVDPPPSSRTLPPPRRSDGEPHVFCHVVASDPSQAESLLRRMLTRGFIEESHRGEHCFFCDDYLEVGKHAVDCAYVAAKAYIDAVDRGLV